MFYILSVVCILGEHWCSDIGSHWRSEREGQLTNYQHYYYSHIFPDSRAHHCNYATLPAGKLPTQLPASVPIAMVNGNTYRVLLYLKLYILQLHRYHELHLITSPLAITSNIMGGNYYCVTLTIAWRRAVRKTEPW